ncbi:MAG: ATP-binding protein [Clostridiales bacterium]|jgi:hypothetical protein|nr:ATP-binding protein [Clostridiales bacterium]
MVIGNARKIDLGTASFEDLISAGNLYVDKTKLIEHFLEEASKVQLVARHRRLGKSLNLDMLRCFLTDSTDNRYLFKGLYIEKSPIWKKVNSAPVFLFDFKSLISKDYKNQILMQVLTHINDYLGEKNLSEFYKFKLHNYMDKNGENTDGLLLLTELVHKHMGKRPYILIDEYDKLLMDNYKSELYDEIREYLTQFFSAGLKGNPYLEKAFITGVMRISHESIMSGLNNLVTYDAFNDAIYYADYGITEEEINELNQLVDFDKNMVKEWYNGIKINEIPIYNLYSTLSYMKIKKFGCYWGKSGTLDIIKDLMNDEREEILYKLLDGKQTEVSVDERISLKDLVFNSSNKTFFSLLVQAGYLSLDEKLDYVNGMRVSIPNKELMLVWKDFILETLHIDSSTIRTLFDNTNDLKQLSQNIENFLSDRLSYYDVEGYKNKNESKLIERIYHVFVLGILSAYDDARNKRPQSEKESGEGRYDIFVEKPGYNFIFEFKACVKPEELEAKAMEALNQIDIKRYSAELDNSKKLIKIGIAFFGKQCKVKCG